MKFVGKTLPDTPLWRDECGRCQAVPGKKSWPRKPSISAPTSGWANPLVMSKTNCAACHGEADDGTFEDGAMHIPRAPAAAASFAASRP